MNRSDVDDPPRPDPWYRHRWPWLLIAGPALTAVGCIVTIVLALEYADPVVARRPAADAAPSAQGRAAAGQR